MNDKQQHLLLTRRANATRVRPDLQPANSARRVVLEVSAGLVLGVPLGVSAYYLVINLFYPVMLCLMFTRLVTAQALNFGLVVDVVLAVFAAAFILYFTHGAIRQRHHVFAWVQLLFALPTVLVMFYLTLILHKPLLPFYGQ